MTTENWVVQVLRARMIERFNSALFPYPVEELLRRLPELGWVVPSYQVAGSEIRLSDAPSKGGVRLALDQNGHLVGVQGSDVDETVATFGELRADMRSQFPQAPEVRTLFVEFVLNGWARTGTSPVAAFSRFWAPCDRAARVGQILGSRLPSDSDRLEPYGLRLASAKLDANRPNWAELRVTPFGAGGDTTYELELIYRNADPDHVETVARAALETLRLALSELES